MAERKQTYAAVRRVTITGVGNLYPDTEENRKLGRNTRAELTPEQAAPLGGMLKLVRTKPVDPDALVTK